MRTILLVDDEHYIREGLRSFIDWKSEGFRISGEAEDGLRAFELIRDTHPDVVLCDIRMPHLDGLGLVQRVREELDHAPVIIILSGYDDFSCAQRALRLGVSNYLLKPVQRDELTSELQHIRERLETEESASTPPVVTAPALDLVLRAPPPERLAEALGVSVSSAAGARTRAYMYVATNFESAGDVAALMDQIELYFVCNRLSLCRRTSPTVLQCVEIRGYSFESRTLREIESAIATQCASRGVRLRAFRGPDVKGVGRASESFAGLEESVRGAFYVDEPFTYRSSAPHEFGYDPNALDRILGITAYITSLSRTALREEIAEIGRSLRERPVQPETVLGAANSLLVDIWKVVADREGSIEELEAATGGAPALDLSIGLGGVLSRIETYSSAAIAYLESIHSDTRNQVVRDVELYVNRNLTERLRVKDIAEHLGLHPYYLGRLFKQQTDMTLTDYVHHARISAAKEMLVRREATLSDIATWVGYGDTEYFSRKFREIVGVAPRTWRDEHR